MVATEKRNQHLTAWQVAKELQHKNQDDNFMANCIQMFEIKFVCMPTNLRNAFHSP